MGNQQNPQQHGNKPTREQNAGQQNPQQQDAGQQNEGEGNRTAARAYNADQHRFAGDRQKIEEAAQAARKAIDGTGGKDLANAEKEGKKHARH
ncbi:MAG TPA: hypothetical protein VN229_20355 [Terriglobales bacterium]|nr:hypothetical protein [Terriglobales bacterium]